MPMRRRPETAERRRFRASGGGRAARAPRQFLPVRQGLPRRRAGLLGKADPTC